VPWPWGRLSP